VAGATVEKCRRALGAPRGDRLSAQALGQHGVGSHLFIGPDKECSPRHVIQRTLTPRFLSQTAEVPCDVIESARHVIQRTLTPRLLS